MTGWYYNKRTKELHTSLDNMIAAIDYARKNNIHNICIGSVDSFSDQELDLAVLSDTNIHRLTIDETVNIEAININPLYTLKTLRELSVPYTNNTIDFSKLIHLEKLEIINSGYEIPHLKLPLLRELFVLGVKNADLRFISSLTGLTSLIIRGAKIRNLSGIEYLMNLHHLELTHCNKLMDLSELQKLQAIQSIEIEHLPEITNISVISDLSNLTSLEIERCKKLRDFSCLRNNQSIEYLFVSDLDSLEFIPQMKILNIFLSGN